LAAAATATATAVAAATTTAFPVGALRTGCSQCPHLVSGCKRTERNRLAPIT
jgi:hypothetical protein